MKNNKFGIPVIIILLIIALPAAVYGLYYNGILEREAGNPDHLPYLDGKLYFYNDSDQLIGYYKCQTSECAEALTSTIDEKDLEKTYSGTKVGVFNGVFVFIDDGGIKLINLNKNGSSVSGEIKVVKNYDGLIDPYIIYADTKDNYTLLNVKTGQQIINDASFIKANSHLSTENFIVEKDNQYYIINQNGEEKSVGSSLEIVDFDNKYIIYKDIYDDYYKIYDIEGVKEYINSVEDYLIEPEFNVIKDANGIKIMSKDFEETFKEITDADVTFKETQEGIVEFYQGKNKIYTYPEQIINEDEEK